MSLSPCACSVHTHCTFCDGKDTPQAMAEAAFQAGVRYFGLSSHSHTPLPEDEGTTLPKDMAAYRETVLRLRAEYEGRMEILLGIELDNLSDVSPAGFDYWIGSAHHLRAPGGPHTVDWDEAHLTACLEEAFHGDGLAMAEAYYQEVRRMAARRPPILGHIDLVTKFNTGNRFFDQSHPRYKQAALEALHTADPRWTLLEINTGAMSRGYRDAPYPELFLLREWRAMGGQIILTADAHSASGILYAYGQSAELAKAAGYAQSVLLTAEGPVLCSLLGAGTAGFPRIPWKSI